MTGRARAGEEPARVGLPACRGRARSFRSAPRNSRGAFSQFTISKKASGDKPAEPTQSEDRKRRKRLWSACPSRRLR